MAPQRFEFLAQLVFYHEKLGKKKIGGALGNEDIRQRSDGITVDEGDTRCWQAYGTPFLRMQWRPTMEDEPQKPNVDLPRAVKDYVELYKQAMIQTGKPDEIWPEPAKDEAPAARISEADAMALRAAFASKDNDALSAALSSLDKYDPIDKNFDDRIAYFRDEIEKVWSAEFAKDRHEATTFVCDTLRPDLPLPLQQVARDSHKLQEYDKALSLALSVSNGGPGISPTEVKHQGMTVLQSRSSDDDWTSSSGVFGAHPGVAYGCHCGAIWYVAPTQCIGWGMGMADQTTHALRFDKTYPHAHIEEDFADLYQLPAEAREFVDNMTKYDGMDFRAEKILEGSTFDVNNVG